MASISMAAGRQNSGQVVLNIVDPSGVGFKNGGKTLGAQRRIVFETAASIREVTLDPKVDIVIQSSWSLLEHRRNVGAISSQQAQAIKNCAP